MKVKLLYASVDYVGEYEETVIKGIEDTEWEEIQDKDYDNIQRAIQERNRNVKYEQIIMVRYPVEPIITPKLLASEYIKRLKEEKEQREKAKVDYKKKKLETKKKRDLAKLEKLKKEYEKTNSPSQ